MNSIPLNLRGVIGTALAGSVLMLVFIKMNSKEKFEYESTIGQITYLDKQFGQLPTRDLGKFRYLVVDSYQYPFEIFVGSEAGDFKPKFEQIDNLRLRDKVTVFYYQVENTKVEGVNRFVQFIDKDNVSYFERGDSSKTIGTVVISLCILLAIGGLVLWKMKKIGF